MQFKNVTDKMFKQALMSVEYRMKHYGKSEEDAKADIFNFFLYKELDKYINSLQSGVITPKEFVIKLLW